MPPSFWNKSQESEGRTTLWAMSQVHTYKHVCVHRLVLPPEGHRTQIQSNPVFFVHVFCLVHEFFSRCGSLVSMKNGLPWLQVLASCTECRRRVRCHWWWWTVLWRRKRETIQFCRQPQWNLFVKGFFSAHAHWWRKKQGRLTVSRLNWHTKKFATWFSFFFHCFSWDDLWSTHLGFLKMNPYFWQAFPTVGV